MNKLHRILVGAIPAMIPATALVKQTPAAHGLTTNDLLGLADLFNLATANPQPSPGQVFVLLPVEDYAALSKLLLTESAKLQG